MSCPSAPTSHYLNSGNFLSHAVGGLSLSGTFDFASGSPLTPHYEAAVADVARGSTGSLRPDRVPGVSLTRAAAPSTTGSTRPPSKTRPTTATALPRVSPSPAPARSLSICPSRRPSASRKCAPSKSAPLSTTSSTPSNTPGSTTHAGLGNLRRSHLHRCHAPVHFHGPLPLLVGDPNDDPSSPILVR